MDSEPWVWALPDWPAFTWDERKVAKAVNSVEYARGFITATGQQLDNDLSNQALLENLLNQAIASSAIEGESVNKSNLRKSLARRLDLSDAPSRPSDVQSEGLADFMLQTNNADVYPISDETLHGWHKALFPTGWSGMRKINVGTYRDCPADITDKDEKKVFFSAPDAETITDEMAAFIAWFNEPPEDLHPLIYSAIAHLWFVIIHPYEDGNGRIARALADLALTKQEKVRLYATAPIMAEKESGYYNALQKTNRSLDITAWLLKYIQYVDKAVQEAHITIDHTLKIAYFWQRYATKGLNERQIKVVKKLLDAGPGGYEGGMRNKKYCSIAKCSNKTAVKDLQSMMKLGILHSYGAGPSTAYDLDWGALKGSRYLEEQARDRT